MYFLENAIPPQNVSRSFAVSPAAGAQIADEGQAGGPSMDHLDALEAQSIYIFREAFARLKNSRCCGRWARIPT
jgi:sulfate adenylyltransferase subunit 2